MPPADPPADGPDKTGGPHIDWYFDFISPFAYLQNELLLRDHPWLKRNCRPVLLAGLLGHWGTKGPAEVPAKRVISYQYCQWLAEKRGIPMKFPPAHPFNPLAALRLSIVLNCAQDCVTGIFRAVYADGADPSQPRDWAEICRRLGVADGAEIITRQWVKERLRVNTEAAARRNVFGVPALVIGERQFWGEDMTAMAIEYLENPGRFDRGEYRRLAALPVGRARKI